MRNRLKNETSPYLLQHQDNPVDWYPWGNEAFAKAASEDKPILLSVGYSACHWCHVMAHESFEDETTAELMNRHFVNIKLDREERPDIDAIYMNAVQAMTGSGGWPMMVVMTPAGQPFFGGTYFPKEERHGLPSFQRVLLSLADAWQTRREDVLMSAANMTQYLSKVNTFTEQDIELGEDILSDALEQLEQRHDARYGGFGSAPKFPPHSGLRFLLRQAETRYHSIALHTLEQMARGGIYDQLGGGFARYSVDEIWLVPHFEKMLYDNAQLVQRYAEAFRLSQNPLYQRIVEETLDWVAREMTSSEGGFYSALDADSEGVEGKYYVWSEEEFDALLGQDSRLAKAAYAISSMGNFEGKNILTWKYDTPLLAERFQLGHDELLARLKSGKERLLVARGRRVRPGLDDKILCSWNSLMVAAYADAGRILKRQDYIDIARRAAGFIRDKMLHDGRLYHSYKAGIAKVNGLLEDYTYYGLALVSLYRASFESEWLELAFNMAETILEHFQDKDNGGFFSTPDDGEALIVRPKNDFDSPNPSDNAAAAELLITLARYADRPDWENVAVQAIRSMTEGMRKHPTGFGTLLCALEQHLSPAREIAIIGPKAQAAELLAVIDQYASPDTVVALIEAPDDPLSQRLPFLQQRDMKGGQVTVYVCEAGVCKLPVTGVAELRQQLKET